MKFGFRAPCGIKDVKLVFFPPENSCARSDSNALLKDILLSSAEVTAQFKRMKNVCLWGERMGCEEPKQLLLLVISRCYGGITA